MSDDGTREVLSRLESSDSRLRIVDNPRRITPCAMNEGIRAAKGRYVALMGAHTEYAKDYVRQCVEILQEHPEACCSGGPILSDGKSCFGKAVAAAMSHPVGIGNAKHRYPEYEGYAEGACFPMFRKEIFSQVGLYDESLVRNQDDDFNFRIAKAGGRVFISPRAWCRYFVRESPRLLFRQYFQYGFWRVAVLRKHKLPASFRQVMPVIFFLLMLALLSATFLLSGWWRLTVLVPPLMYAGVLFSVAAGVAIKKGLRVGIGFPLAVFILHSAYAAGFLWAILRTKKTGSGNSVSSEVLGT